MNIKSLFLSFIAIPLLLACGNNNRSSSQSDSTPLPTREGQGGGSSKGGSSLTLSYAKGFTVRTLDNGIRLVDIADPQTDEDKMPVSYHFALVPKGQNQLAHSQPLPKGGETQVDGEKNREDESPSLGEGTEVGSHYTIVPVPVDRTIVTTMLQLSNFTTLDALDVVKGITGTKNLFNKEVRERVEDGRIVKIGMEGNFDTELILAANPEVIFISPFKRGGYDVIKETGITLIPHLGYKELHPLGQAEWIKFVGLFLGKEAEADSIFAGIEERYNTLKQKADAKDASGKGSLHSREGLEGAPKVFSGEMHGGNWYAVGGKSTLAQLFRDAGAEYVINDDNTGGVNIEFEQLYAMAADADYWRILNSFPGEFSYEALKASEPRNELFRAFREKKVIYCNMKQTPYYELAPVAPDLILADFIAIFHPELMPKDYQPTFYRLLK